MAREFPLQQMLVTLVGSCIPRRITKQTPWQLQNELDRAGDPSSPSNPISLSPAAWACRWLKGKLHSCQCAACCIKVNCVVSCKIWCFKICFRNYLNALPLGVATPVCQALEGRLQLSIAHCCCSVACCADFLVLVNTAQESGFTVKCAVSNRAII